MQQQPSAPFAKLSEDVAGWLDSFVKLAPTTELIRKDLSAAISKAKTGISELGTYEAFTRESDGGLGLGGRELVELATICGKVLFPLPLAEYLLMGPLRHRFTAATSFVDAEILAPFGEVGAKVLENSHYADRAWLLERAEGRFCAHKINHSGSIKLSAADLARELYTLQVGERLNDTVPAEPLLGAYHLIYAAELAGAAAKTLEMTLEYVKTRKQFGVAIGSFQVVQHKLADMHTHLSAMNALNEFAGWAIDCSPEQLPKVGRSAFCYAKHHAQPIIESAIQLHGGVGFTYEYDLHLYLRRAIHIKGYCG